MIRSEEIRSWQSCGKNQVVELKVKMKLNEYYKISYNYFTRFTQPSEKNMAELRENAFQIPISHGLGNKEVYSSTL